MSRKHIKAKAALSADHNFFSLEIVSMEGNVGTSNFIDRSRRNDSLKDELPVFIHNGILLGYNDCCACAARDAFDWKPKEPCDFILCCKVGEASPKVKVEFWPRIKECIEAYNEFYKE